MKERPRLENWKKFPSGAISKCQSLRERMNRSNDNIIIFIFNKCVFVFFQKKKIIKMMKQVSFSFSIVVMDIRFDYLENVAKD